MQQSRHPVAENNEIDRLFHCI